MNATANVLIVDDEESVRRSYARLLGEAHCSAEAARDGAEALRAMEQRPFDVVLLDLRMPGADGLAVLEEIKQKWPASEVVVITGYPTIESAKQALQLGAYDYLAKPADPEDVINAARGAMLRKQWGLQPEPATVH
jgi:DNA-binding NtrC family response regulator